MRFLGFITIRAAASHSVFVWSRSETLNYFSRCFRDWFGLLASALDPTFRICSVRIKHNRSNSVMQRCGFQDKSELNSPSGHGIFHALNHHSLPNHSWPKDMSFPWCTARHRGKPLVGMMINTQGLQCFGGQRGRELQIWGFLVSTIFQALIQFDTRLPHRWWRRRWTDRNQIWATTRDR